jgi:menaquinone-dependent protoporphyrinogen IX oxidase
MRHILIVYGTTDGHTRKIAQVLAEDLRPVSAVGR